MSRYKVIILLITASAFIFSLYAFKVFQDKDKEILSYIVDPQKKHVGLYWKDDEHKLIGSLSALKNYAEKHHGKLLFAANGGMYMEDQTPLGLFIQNKKTLHKLNVREGRGNFYMKPNGVFYLTDKRVAGICKTEAFNSLTDIEYATQSGPMLVIDGEIHSSFTEGSVNVNIRNGVGILPDNSVIFAMSKNPINFYDFALYFKNMGCRNALYLDGFVSRTYLPEKNWIQNDGNFGVIIGVTN